MSFHSLHFGNHTDVTAGRNNRRRQQFCNPSESMATDEGCTRAIFHPPSPSALHHFISKCSSWLEEKVQKPQKPQIYSIPMIRAFCFVLFATEPQSWLAPCTHLGKSSLSRMNILIQKGSIIKLGANSTTSSSSYSQTELLLQVQCLHLGTNLPVKEARNCPNGTPNGKPENPDFMTPGPGLFPPYSTFYKEHSYRIRNY